MDTKKDILWRVYLSYLGMILFGIVILGKIFYIQHVQGAYWKSMADSLHDRYVSIDAARGTIYSQDGRMLSTSLPQFDIHLDMLADGLSEKNGEVFKKNLDSLSLCLSKLFRDRSPQGYAQLLKHAYQSKDRYFLLKKDLSYEQYRKLEQFPMFRLGRNTSGMIAEQHDIRINPFGLLANRTIGLWRENAPNVGLEATYNSYLKGVNGKRLMRRIAGGTYIPLEGYEIEPENGKDIYTNINVNIQDIAENALYKMLDSNQATHGTCIVMEVKTGKIRAIANLGRQPDGSYAEDYNYGVGIAAEPGSVFKLATMISLLDDKKININDIIDIGHGTYNYGNRTMRDAESHKSGIVTVKEAFEMSSNVGISKIAYQGYSSNPYQYLAHLHKLHLDTLTGIDLFGEAHPLIKNPKSRTWSATTLPWMSVGYEVQVSPIQILTLYNAIANNGVMMRPYLVNRIEQFGKVIKRIPPQVVINKVCSESTLKQLHTILDGVVSSPIGTAHEALYNSEFSIAGKTGTALVANGSHGYADKIYQATFVGYFPADHPMYSCIVVIKNKPHALHYYGAAVAAPVFREVAHKLYALEVRKELQPLPSPVLDSGMKVMLGNAQDIHHVLQYLEFPLKPVPSQVRWVKPVLVDGSIAEMPISESVSTVPDVLGMGLKDALYLLEKAGLQVQVSGKGSVSAQSMHPGSVFHKGDHIAIQLG